MEEEHVMKKGQNGWHIAPVLIVQSVERSVCSYRDKLGFQIIGTFGSPLEMASVGREGVQLMLQDGAGKPRPGSNRSYKSVAWDAHIWVENVDALYDELGMRGATILKPPTVALYGNREIEVADLDGHVLCFGQLPSEKSRSTQREREKQR